MADRPCGALRPRGAVGARRASSCIAVGRSTLVRSSRPSRDSWGNERAFANPLVPNRAGRGTRRGRAAWSGDTSKPVCEWACSSPCRRRTAMRHCNVPWWLVGGSKSGWFVLPSWASCRRSGGAHLRRPHMEGQPPNSLHRRELLETDRRCGRRPNGSVAPAEQTRIRQMKRKAPGIFLTQWQGAAKTGN
jgi:hypothetical protein